MRFKRPPGTERFTADVPAIQPQSTMPSVPFNKSQIRTYQRQEEYLKDAKSSDIVIAIYCWDRRWIGEPQPVTFWGGLNSETPLDNQSPSDWKAVQATSESGNDPDGVARVVIVRMQGVWEVEKDISEFIDNLSNMGFPKEGLRVVYELPEMVVHPLVVSGPSVPSRVNKGVVLTTTWGQLYGETLDNRELEKEVESMKEDFMRRVLGNVVNAGWHVMSLYPETPEKAWQVIEFILSDKDYIYDPIFRFPRGYVWKEGDDVSFK
ncbi:hypothetical protein CC1G_11917 [Coprinopsis cinerea okayama7|uniref:Uncharacterized protein n=1 Tax=Coprinopsis cinerea (strain Okayama-7 / 130 / ATCC MYA-4618 / FGSC 9003) TaxID=240176 RepID=A8NDE1_COPC7|nr:hypothetical protein CC1G_11917 [Coprinopsis cinerea okayama7\|eukprot:XP_001832753.2 hypothetical protein CC1G_11917 [Coprinopsis cinerea okayama7\